MQEDSRRQLVAIRKQLDALIAAPTVPLNLGSLLNIADRLTELLLLEIARARTEGA